MLEENVLDFHSLGLIYQPLLNLFTPAKILAQMV